MKIVAVNGSPRGRESNTSILLNAFLTGAEKAGAETLSIFLAEKNIGHCKGCLACWFALPGQCVLDDDMAEILSQGEGADMLILGTPLKYANISSMLKAFVERMILLCNPYFQKDRETGMIRHPKKAPAAESAGMSFYRAKLLMIANGGLSTRDHFQPISQWVKKLAFYNHTEVIGEIYNSQGLFLNTQVAELRPLIDTFLEILENAGREIVTENRLSPETEKMLAQDFMPVELYLEHVTRFFDGMLSKLEHPYSRG